MSRMTNKLYLIILLVISLALYWYHFINVINFDSETLIFWGFLAIVSETFLVLLPNGAATSVGMAIYLAAMMTESPLIAMLATTIAFLLRMPSVDGKRTHLFNLRFGASLFNICSHAIIVGIMGVIYGLFIDSTDSFNLKAAVGIITLIITEPIAIGLVSGYLITYEGKSNISLIKSFIGAIPSALAVGTLGLFLVYADVSMDAGKVIVALFFVPLLLARTSFKLYFDSQKAGQETIEALNEALHVRDAYTAGHTDRVSRYAALLAKAMNYSSVDMERLMTASKLHDIGKIGIPDNILNKPGKLTEDEYQQIKDHAAMGHKILSNVDSLKRVAEVVRHHHERADGKGYPDGLLDHEIPRDSAVLSIADTYDAMTSDRPYRKALTDKKALQELLDNRGTQFNAYLVDVFVEQIHMLKEKGLNPSEVETLIISGEPGEVTT